MSTKIEDARIEDEYRALREGCAVIDRSGAGRLELLGKDRQRFINAHLTCDGKGLAPAAGGAAPDGGPRAGCVACASVRGRGGSSCSARTASASSTRTSPAT